MEVEVFTLLNGCEIIFVNSTYVKIHRNMEGAEKTGFLYKGDVQMSFPGIMGSGALSVP